MVESLTRMNSVMAVAIQGLLKHGTSGGASLHIQLAIPVILLATLVGGIACQEKAPRTLGETVVAEDGTAVYADRADYLLQSIADACSFLVSEQDVFKMAIRTRDAVQEQDEFDVSILEVLEAAHDSVRSNEIRPVNCEETFTTAVVVLIIENALDEVVAK